ncbi:hypothetical protein [Deinococcus aquatilis]|uniref:hypothetical protein n=1 Tax=Deinococcus aquatilis TaxID=519440 RepID=UPI000379869B|nr:hypothetical protein [Deinococcus aquatilis]
MRTHLGSRLSGFLFESNRAGQYTLRMVQRVVHDAAVSAGIERAVTPQLVRASAFALLLDARMPLD